MIAQVKTCYSFSCKYIVHNCKNVSCLSDFVNLCFCFIFCFIFLFLNYCILFLLSNLKMNTKNFKEKPPYKDNEIVQK